MSDEKFMALRKHWYEQDIILFNLVERTKYKETVFLRKGCVHRCLKINAMRYMVMNWERYHFHSEDFNLYSSLGHFPDLPVFSFNRLEKRKEQDEFNLKYKQYLTGFDFLCDVDGEKGDIGSALKSLRKILPHFKGVPYWVQFSANKGFHLRVDYEDMPDEFKQMPVQDLCDLFKRFAENFSLINNIPDIDYSIFDTRRIAKLSYSISFPYFFVVLPMSDEQINNFNLGDYSIKTQLNNLSDLRNRGFLKREGSAEKFGELITKYANLK